MNRHTACVLACLILGCALRFAGLTRGVSDFVLPEQARSGIDEMFYRFHPDEGTLVRAALELRTPLDPPLTVYGMLPIYLARGVLEITFLALDPEPAEEPFVTYCAVRTLAAALSCLSLWLVYLIARHCFGWQVACLSLFFVAAVPIAVQQAHFYTVDGPFALLVLAFFYVALKTLESPRLGMYALSGALIGAAAAVRLNGLLLGAVLLVGHLLGGASVEGETGVARLRRRLLLPDLWLSALAATAVLLLLQPFLITAPGLLRQLGSTDDFLYALLVARGEILSPWSLADMHTVPFLHYWTDLFPLGAGWPLTGTFILGTGWALWRGKRARLLLLLWVGIYFLLIGGLHTKYVRYLLPLLPFLCFLAADFCWGLCRMEGAVWRSVGKVLTVGVVVYTGVYGLAFARIYTVEDSRIQAGRWIDAHVPAGRVIAVERGGFSLEPLISGQSHRAEFLGMSAIFSVRGYLTCEATQQFLEETLRPADYIAIVDANRYRQFTAVPDLFPAMASFYRKLVNGELGFEQAQRFKVYPSLGPIQFRDDRGEPSFLGFDHPAVFIFKRLDRFDEAWTQWRQELAKDPCCVDSAAREVAAAFQTGDMARTLALAQDLSQSYPDMRFAALIEADVHHRQGNVQRVQAARQRYLQNFADPLRKSHLIPWASARSLGELGFDELALSALWVGTQFPFPASARLPMALSYISIAEYFHTRGEPANAAEAYRMSTQVQLLPQACNALASSAYQAGRPDQALGWWEQSLEIDDTQAQVYAHAGKVAGEQQDYERALRYLERAVRLEPRLGAELESGIEAARTGTGP